MIKKNSVNLIILLVISLLFVKVNYAFASIEISEIMYDLSGTDTDLEWIELHSIGAETNLTDYKFFDGSNHAINPPGTNGSIGSMVIPEDGYAVLSANAISFKSAHPGFGGTVLDTVMSLNNTGTTIKIIDASGQTVAQATYSSSLGANGDGNSLNKNGTTFSPAPESPGAINKTSTSGGETEESEETPQEEIEDKSKLEITINKENIYTKSPFVFNIDARNYSGDRIYFGNFNWNFGDGNSKIFSENQPVAYQYDFAGVYIVTLEFSQYPYPTPSQIITKTLELNVSDPQILISKVGDAKDPYVEISNLSERSIDISGYVLKSDSKQLVFPKNSKIYAKSKLVIPSRVSGFNYSDISKLSLMYENKSLIHEFSINPIPVYAKSSTVARTIKSTPTSNQSATSGNVLSVMSDLPQEKISQDPQESQLSQNNLASVVSAINSNTSEPKSKSMRNILLLVMILVSGICMIYLLRTGVSEQKEDPDFIYDE